MQQPPRSKKPKSPFLQALKLIRKHFVWASAVAAGLASLAGVLNLLVFTRYIGRQDVFMDSLELGPGLVVLMLSYVLIFIAITGSMLITSYFFTLAPSWLRHRLETNRLIVRHLLEMTVSGMFSIVLVVVAVTYFSGDKAGHWWMLTVFILPALLSWVFIGIHIETDTPLSWKKKLCLCGALTGLVGFTAITGIYPALYVTYLYEESPDLSELAEIFKFGFTCLVTMAASLAPATGFYLMAKEGRRAQIRGALIGLLAFLGLLTFTIPTVFSVPSVGAVNLLGISDREVRRYLISSAQYSANSLNPARWSITEYENGRYSLEAFSLYEYGPVNLLCPADLSAIRNKYLSQHTKACIDFKSKDVDSLDAVDQQLESIVEADSSDLERG
ncbi:TPA: hypothetical protein ACGS08_004214 [Pseudomonas aeruginosa]|uniref:hypothetical protein n=1 Tax=Pseudomonas aeruginosa TaxID=287 RepID=UPI00372785C1